MITTTTTQFRLCIHRLRFPPRILCLHERHHFLIRSLADPARHHRSRQCRRRQILLETMRDPELASLLHVVVLALPLLLSQCGCIMHVEAIEVPVGGYEVERVVEERGDGRNDLVDLGRGGGEEVGYEEEAGK